ncbi:cytokine receptor-like factor 3 isoform X1 [Octopus sinensis]|uniref:Cytokine receptor-like factor 3 isoform X1 n=2 Tax=Octopus sinensis TaxID=2607531 RepID=A0A6P7SBH9_9MOLL|nr:cytokine receptor-like factor 3 isoform X1 [Octopus sinensis]
MRFLLIVEENTIMSLELQQNVEEIIDFAKQQQTELHGLLVALQEAKDQITSSGAKSRNQLNKHFESLKTELNAALDNRLSELLCQVDKIEQTSLPPLDECKDLINQGICKVNRIIEEGKLILDSSSVDGEKVSTFRKNSDSLNLNSVPAIPSLSEVACISVDTAGSNKDKLLEYASKEMKVISKAPVQIADVVERPGALLVKWSETEEDFDATEFCLQYASGVIKSNEDTCVPFHNAYLGANSLCLVKHLQTNHPYSFRTRCRADPDTAWSVWSVPTVASTTLPHYEWNADNPAYMTTNENQTATKCCDGDSVVLYSCGCLYTACQSITFRVLAAGDSCPGDGVGLSINKSFCNTLRRPGAAYVTVDGEVYVDGQEMKNKLPYWGKSSSVTFDTEVLSNGKVRVTIQVEEKEVTFDWNVPLTEPYLQTLNELDENYCRPRDKFYFAMVFANREWMVCVE